MPASGFQPVRSRASRLGSQWAVSSTLRRTRTFSGEGWSTARLQPDIGGTGTGKGMGFHRQVGVTLRPSSGPVYSRPSAVAAVPVSSVPARRPSTSSPQGLLERCASQDAEAWRELYRGWFRRAGGALRRLGVRDSDLEDACQDVFENLVRNLTKYRGDAAFDTWLYRLCITEARRRRHTYQRWQRTASALQRATPEGVVATQELSGQRLRAVLDRALSCMNDEERSVFVLVEFEGLSGKQVAEITDCAVNTVYTRLFRARQTFRSALGLGSGTGEP